MAVNDSRLPTVAAVFADAAKAERAVAQLQQAGIDAERIDIAHGGAAAPDRTTAAEPGRTAAEDRDIVDNMSGSFVSGALTGTVVGAVLGAVIGGLAFGWLSAGFWATTIGVGAALGGVGALWGMFAGFAGRSRRTRRYDAEHRPDLPDAVRVTVHTKPGEEDTVHRILHDRGGAG